MSTSRSLGVTLSPEQYAWVEKTMDQLRKDTGKSVSKSDVVRACINAMMERTHGS